MSEENPQKMSHEDMLRMTAQVVSAYVGNNMLPAAQISEVIKSVYGSLMALEGEAAETVAEPLKPAVPIRKSITPDYVVCLEDGKKLKMLKRHLRTTYDMTPDEYRAKWNLPPDYPMVSPNYAKQRSKLAKEIGLGNSGRRRRQ